MNSIPRTEEKSNSQYGLSEKTVADNGLPVKRQFSLSEPVEQTETLLALHNMDAEKLRRTLDLGAWPSPSIAIVEAAQGHSNYGEFSAVFPRSVIDPETDSRNKVYGSDAWTPTWRNAQVEYEVDFDEALAVVSPDDAPIELLAAMRNAGMNVMEYKAGDEQDRLGIINGLEGAKFSIDEDYEQELTEWDRNGRRNGEVFILGSTGDVLQGLGAMENDIYMHSDKMNTIMKEHPEMTLDELKQIPVILDDPVLIIKSNGESRGGQNTRMVITGAVKAKNGKPVMAVLDLRPVEGKLVIDDMQKVNSAFARSNAANYIQSSEVMYADKKRAIPLLRTMGLQSRPIELLRNGSMGSITYDLQNVNLDGVPMRDILRTVRYSIGEDSDGNALSEQQREYFKNTSNLNPTENEDIRYSVSEDDEVLEAKLPTAEDPDIMTTLPVKAQQYLKRTERTLLDNVSKALRVPRFAQREYLQGIVREISTEYLRDGRVSQETIDDLTEGAYTAEEQADGSILYVRNEMLAADNLLSTAMAAKRLPAGFYTSDIIAAMNKGHSFSAQRAMVQWDYYINTGFPDRTLRTQFTTDESNLYSKIHANVDTYMSSNIPRFITGDLNIRSEKDWNDYCKMMSKYTPEKVTALYQKIYESTR